MDDRAWLFSEEGEGKTEGGEGEVGGCRGKAGGYEGKACAGGPADGRKESERAERDRPSTRRVRVVEGRRVGITKGRGRGGKGGRR